jgi:excisionase family DNA binding protein
MQKADAKNETSTNGAEAEFVTPKEVADRLKISLGTVSNWRKTGKLPWINGPGRLVRFHWPSVTAAMLRMQRGAE